MKDKYFVFKQNKSFYSDDVEVEEMDRTKLGTIHQFVLTILVATAHRTYVCICR